MKLGNLITGTNIHVLLYMEKLLGLSKGDRNGDVTLLLVVRWPYTEVPVYFIQNVFVLVCV